MPKFLKLAKSVVRGAYQGCVVHPLVNLVMLPTALKVTITSPHATLNRKRKALGIAKLLAVTGARFGTGGAYVMYDVVKASRKAYSQGHDEFDYHKTKEHLIREGFSNPAATTICNFVKDFINDQDDDNADFRALYRTLPFGTDRDLFLEMFEAAEDLFDWKGIEVHFRTGYAGRKLKNVFHHEEFYSGIGAAIRRKRAGGSFFGSDIVEF